MGQGFSQRSLRVFTLSANPGLHRTQAHRRDQGGRLAPSAAERPAVRPESVREQDVAQALLRRCYFTGDAQ